MIQLSFASTSNIDTDLRTLRYSSAWYHKRGYERAGHLDEALGSKLIYREDVRPCMCNTSAVKKKKQKKKNKICLDNVCQSSLIFYLDDLRLLKIRHHVLYTIRLLFH